MPISDEGLETFAPSVVESPNTWAAALDAYHAEQFAAAELAFRRLIAQQDRTADAHAYLGYTLHHLGCLDDAAEHYGRAAALGSREVDARFLLAVIRQNQHRFPEAAEAFTATLQLAPTCGPAMVGLGAVLGEQGNWLAASAWLARGLATDPSSLGVLLALVGALSNQPDRQLKRATLEGLLPNSPLRSMVLFHLAYMLQEDQDWAGATALLREVVANQPVFIDSRLHLAYACERQENWTDAALQYAAAVEIDSDNVQAWRGCATALDRLDRVAEAAVAYAQLARLEPSDADTWTRLWHLRRQLGDHEGAADACRRAFSSRTGNAQLRLGLVSTLHAAHQSSEALAHCRTLLRQGAPGVPWPQFMDTLKEFVAVPPRALPENVPKTWDYFHYNPDKVLAMLTAALTIRDRFPHTPRVFLGQGLIVWEKSMGFLEDERFLECTKKYDQLRMMVNWEWNLHVIQWAARQALRVPGDFVELGVYRGYTTAVTAEYLDFQSQARRWFLYDTFAGIPADQRTDGWPHAYDAASGETHYREVLALFSRYQNIEVIRGRVPEALLERGPEQIAFAHIDLNSATAEVGALDVLYDRMSPGAVVVFDDYGWFTARQQFDAENDWMRRRGLGILELPTGQGLFVKPPL